MVWIAHESWKRMCHNAAEMPSSRTVRTHLSFVLGLKSLNNLHRPEPTHSNTLLYWLHPPTCIMAANALKIQLGLCLPCWHQASSCRCNIATIHSWSRLKATERRPSAIRNRQCRQSNHWNLYCLSQRDFYTLSTKTKYDLQTTVETVRPQPRDTFYRSTETRVEQHICMFPATWKPRWCLNYRIIAMRK